MSDHRHVCLLIKLSTYLHCPLILHFLFSLFLFLLHHVIHLPSPPSPLLQRLHTQQPLCRLVTLCRLLLPTFFSSTFSALLTLSHHPSPHLHLLHILQYLNSHHLLCRLVTLTPAFLTFLSLSPACLIFPCSTSVSLFSLFHHFHRI